MMRTCLRSIMTPASELQAPKLFLEPVESRERAAGRMDEPCRRTADTVFYNTGWSCNLPAYT
jgi:hypothetical protein